MQQKTCFFEIDFCIIMWKNWKVYIVIESAKDLSLQVGMIVITDKETNQYEYHDLAVLL